MHPLFPAVLLLALSTTACHAQTCDPESWIATRLGGGPAGPWSVTSGSLVTGSVVLDATTAMEPAAGVSNLVMGLTNSDAETGAQTVMDFNAVLPHVMAGQ